MTVISSAQSVVQPGRWEDAIALSGEVAKVLERHGASDNRLMTAATAGEATGTCLFLSEYPNMEAYGSASDAVLADAELNSIMERIRGSKSPIVLTGQSLASEIPLERKGNTNRGQYVEVHISRPTPGEMDKLIDLSREVADFVEAHGATNAQLSTITAAGSFAGSVSMSWEFPTMRALGKLGDLWMSDPKGLAIYQSSISAKPSSTEIFSGVYQVIPI
jgi:hypothetical protein